ncbi:MAG: hypothetical protein OXF57_05840, partial [Rhodospirillaceae bacterium]|nr:hypothetical protein [Rhodospirillaceae bacterium]
RRDRPQGDRPRDRRPGHDGEHQGSGAGSADQREKDIDQRRAAESRQRGLFALLPGGQGFEQSFDFTDAACETPKEAEDRDLERSENAGKNEDCNELGGHAPRWWLPPAEINCR